jgi:F5/8 type C domain-containing protein/glycosyl hydrolase family 26
MPASPTWLPCSRAARTSSAAHTLLALATAVMALAFGAPAHAATNIALNRPALASSVEGTAYVADNAFDGNTGTRWSAAYNGDAQWLQVDLGTVSDISSVRLQWETAYASAYRIEVSDTGSAWTSIYSTTTGDGAIDDLTTARGRGRYVRMSATARGTAYSYSLWEMAVLGSEAGIPSGTWLSGASGTGVANGDYGTWRGTPVAIAATWADTEAASVGLWQLDPGAEYGAWSRSIDIAVGAFDAGGSWAYAASGTYDARWRQSLTNLKARWGTRSGTVYIRFAHEMNGDWYPWSVNSGNYTQFISGWKRYRALQKEIFPAAKLVFSVNRNSVNTGMDWRSAFPGSAYVDVLGVDYYNQSPYAGTTAEFDSSILMTDGYGAPIGLKRHQEFAASVGLPFAVSEWSGNADLGDSPAYIQGMFDFFRTNGGTGAGNLLYEIQFNVDQDNARWMLYPTTRMPLSAAKYQQLF